MGLRIFLPCYPSSTVSVCLFSYCPPCSLGWLGDCMLLPLVTLPHPVGHAIYCLLLHGSQCILYSGSVVDFLARTGAGLVVVVIGEAFAVYQKPSLLKFVQSPLLSASVCQVGAG